jgi:lipopolysaccharide/colanic/teichoic acid biosynthesis glycosyltransferase
VSTVVGLSYSTLSPTVARPRRRPVLVMGDARFCGDISGRRRGWRRPATTCTISNDPASLHAAAGRLEGATAIVQGELLGRLWRSAPESVRAARRVRVVYGDERRPPLTTTARSFKRAFDIVVAPLAFVLVLPIVLLCALAVWLDSGGPVVFVQTRIGAGGRPFRLLKLRTMTHGNDDSTHRAYVADLIAGRADAENGLYKLANDPRVTGVGRVLRKLSLDELPQLWNVVRGEMSLIGPRPPLPSEAELYDDRAWERLYVKPGVTGLWQVSGRSTLSFDEMVQLDVEYWRSWSPARDVAILLRSLPVVISARGAR